MHRLLKRQLQRAWGNPPGVPSEWQSFINLVNDTYWKFDAHRKKSPRPRPPGVLEPPPAPAGSPAALPDLVLRLNHQGTILDLKADAASGQRLEPRAWLGKPLQATPLQAVARQFSEAIRQVIRDNAPVSLEYSLLRAEGTNHYEARLVPLSATKLLVITHDLTARKQMEAELAQERDLLRTLLDHSPDFIYFKDTQSRFIKSSTTQALKFGLASPDEVVGKTDFDFFTEAHARVAFGDEQEIIRTGQPMIGKVERQIVLNGQKEAWTITTKMPFRNQAGDIIGTFGVSKDITPLKQAEQDLRDSRQQLQQITASIHEAVWLRDARTRKILYVNPAFEKITGHTSESFCQNSGLFLKSLHPADKPRVLKAWKDSNQGRDFDEEHRILRPDGSERWVRGQRFPVRNEAGESYRFANILEDITERKRMETRLLQSQKLEIVGKLAGGVAHEFNNILTTIIGQSSMLLEDLPPGHPLAENAAEIRKAADRAAKLTRQLLAYGRKQYLRPQPLNLNQVMADMEKVVCHLMGGPLADVKIIPGPGLHWVRADAGQIEQVILNLALNAHEAMPNGGQLTLQTANLPFDEHSSDLDPELMPGDYVMLAITDTGVGMSEQVKARLFEPFFTTKDVGRGTGLGLSTCYGIIKQSGGHISAQSEPGRGTTFKIYLPRIAPAGDSSKSAPRPV